MELELRSVDICGWRRTREPVGEPSEKGREPTINRVAGWK